MAKSLTYQKEGPDVGDLVKLHQESQGFLVVAAILTIHRESLPLQNRKQKAVCPSVSRRHVVHLRPISRWAYSW